MVDDRVSRTTRVVIAGGGPSGSLLGLFLARDDRFDVSIFEASTPEEITDPSNRSYNVVITKRGLGALQEGGVDLMKEVSGTSVLCSFVL